MSKAMSIEQHPAFKFQNVKVSRAFAAKPLEVFPHMPA